ncbi:PREDICTED: CASP-like protein 2A1 [Nelumbo nucifera]|uniref:CASP-like protein n=1 Tax=Nelumbo nucifera TaxID=4432 RepID=A0A1U7ZJS4_NELNU|nr:PREDICTED: CASP-like protein 2A1 [Nelumbo nucifera]
MKTTEKEMGGVGGVSPPEVALGDGEEKGHSGVRTAETLLRLLPIALCVTALVVMVKNSEENDFGSAIYSHFGGFRYLVYANGICAGYSLLSAFYATVPPASNTRSRAWIVFVLDQVMTYVILAAGTVSAEVLYLAYKGDDEITWSQACGTFGGFCRKATASVATTYVAVACYAGLSLISSYRLFSSYDAPIGYPSKGVQNAAFLR